MSLGSVDGGKPDCNVILMHIKMLSYVLIKMELKAARREIPIWDHHQYQQRKKNMYNFDFYLTEFYVIAIP